MCSTMYYMYMKIITKIHLFQFKYNYIYEGTKVDG